MKKQNAITLISLIVTIVVLLILAGITIDLTLGERGIFTTAQRSAIRTDEEKAREEMGLKLLEIEKEAIIQMPESKLQFIADKLCEDDDIEYVLTSSQVASIDPIEVGDATRLYVKFYMNLK